MSDRPKPAKAPASGTHKTANRGTPKRKKKSAPPSVSKPTKAARTAGLQSSNEGDSASAAMVDGTGTAFEINPVEFRKRLTTWYRIAARALPWRGTSDAYYIWVSEIMLQQTRVTAVIEHYNEFLRRFPSLLSLALAAEADVLAAWSGLGYYRRARMLHKSAQFIVLEREGRLPASSGELRTLPGIGEYTAAAIASIAFGEPVAVVDGNVERVILRLAGRDVQATAAERKFVRMQAQALVPDSGLQPLHPNPSSSPEPEQRNRVGSWNAKERIALAASGYPTETVGGHDSFRRAIGSSAGDHNQAMMELGATVCLPRKPQCSRCPVVAMCRTRGEHATLLRAPQRSETIACLLDLRKRGTVTEVLLSLRGSGSSMMPAMLELPALPLHAVEGREPALRVRHSITNTNYYVQVFAPCRDKLVGGRRSMAPQLRRSIVKGYGELHWAGVSRLGGLPITGLTRKILQRLHVMESARMNVLE